MADEGPGNDEHVQQEHALYAHVGPSPLAGAPPPPAHFARLGEEYELLGGVVGRLVRMVARVGNRPGYYYEFDWSWPEGCEFALDEKHGDGVEPLADPERTLTYLANELINIGPDLFGSDYCEIERTYVTGTHIEWEYDYSHGDDRHPPWSVLWRVPTPEREEAVLRREEVLAEIRSL